ncbi:hypothetical protein CONLIGDRAFT_670447 [Coniochaeta ligniaria NRRL 30616]|uniref:Ribosomal protein S21 n=1 Tax=Coniochaeta ligniaria NRRL 30616 TaxID=1408157 RepID=A0A1J7J5U0_9PEZI|nr:hypothetical protein CONLIGDRAFT_670447 [Coniochaeta ligniaria NRRL 30616]
MELRLAVQFASRTTPSRLWATTSSQCRALISTPSRAFSTTRPSLAPNDRQTQDLLAALQANPSRPRTTTTTTPESTSSLPPRPPPSQKPSWADLRPSTAPTSKPTSPASSSATSDPYLDDMAMLPDMISWDINEFRSANKLARPVPLEMRNLRASTGRTIEKYGNVDVARAFTLLDMACNRNGVPRDLRRQKFHERPGLKRKRLRSERWRKMFKLGFRATVSRVSELRRQGW